MLSRARIWRPQPGQRERGFDSDSPRGSRQMTTLRNDPIARPRTPARTAAAPVLMARSYERRYGRDGDGEARRDRQAAGVLDAVARCGRSTAETGIRSSSASRSARPGMSTPGPVSTAWSTASAFSCMR